MTDPAKRPERDEHGRLLPGHNVRSPGRPRLPDIARDFAPEAWAHLIALAKGEVKDTKLSRGQAVLEVLDRVYGRAVQAHEIDDNALPPALVMFARLTAKREAAPTDEGEKP